MAADMGGSVAVHRQSIKKMHDAKEIEAIVVQKVND